MVCIETADLFVFASVFVSRASANLVLSVVPTMHCIVLGSDPGEVEREAFQHTPPVAGA